MKYFFTFLLMSFFLPLSADGDTLILKNGRQIQADRIWEEDGIVKYSKYGSVIGYCKENVDKIIYKTLKKPSKLEKSFKFDIWHSGMSIAQVMTVAERNDIPLHRTGLISANKHFNPKISQKYMHTATEFYYNDKLMGKPAKVMLCFTPQSKLLSMLKIHLYGNDIKRKSAYTKDIETMLTKKYGKPLSPVRKELFYDSLLWESKKGGFRILTKTGMGYLDIVYSDSILVMKGVQENKAKMVKKRKEYHHKDASKF